MSRRTASRQRFYDIERRNRAFVRAWRIRLDRDPEAVDESICGSCGGEGQVENDDGLYDGDSYYALCRACQGSGFNPPF